MTKTYEALAKAVTDNGIDTMFGLIGDGNLYFVDSYIRDCGGRFISAANERGAALMALGHGRATGTPGCATVTHGGALTNTVSALTQGVKARTPMVLLCGDTALADRDNFQKIPQRQIVVATGAGFEQLRSPQTIAEDVATAIRRASFERRPIVLNIPVDFQWLDADYTAAPYRRPSQRALVPESSDLDDAIGIIAAARRPVVLAGKGAVDEAASAEISKFAARLEAPLCTTLEARDLFRDEPFNLGICGTLSHDLANELLMEADCIVGFGASFNSWTMGHGSFSKGKRIVQVDIDPSQIGRFLRPDAGVMGDAGLTANLFGQWLDEAEIPGCGWRSDDLARRLADFDPYEGIADPAPDDPVDMKRAIRKLEEAFPRDRVVVTDGGRFLSEPWRHLRVEHPRDFLITVALGSIGFGMSYAIGAAVAKPDRKVLHVTGDGGFMLGGLGEFNTAVRYGLNIVTVVCNDGAYGAEHIQFRNKDMDPKISVFDWPDFARVAESLGGKGYTVRTHEDLDTALAGLGDQDGPVLIDMRLDPDEMPPLL
ncbi:thiamine pyrophosphate-binding protein [Henriciella aquimarina]|uniref:thiamine pyrophosphate-binding protein n=1 Tax=Henriciella aquimarina TaxID=545261 RepID=UPI000A023A90|nr:thiamine pyrophosphate-binding protein [Henriciella aquimarina]